MSVTLSLKVCQQTDQADKPELSRECNPANKVETDSSGLSAPHHTSLTLSGSVRSAPTHELERVYQAKQTQIYGFYFKSLTLSGPSRLQRVCRAVLPLFLLFFPALPRLTVEILCCSAKALHLPVITSHPSLLRLPGVEPPCAPRAPLPHPTPSTPPADIWSLRQLCGVHPELYTWSWWVSPACEHCCCCDACRLLLAVP